jgi:hypothetical protein
MEVHIRVTNPANPNAALLRSGEVYSVRPDGKHISPVQAADWIDGNVIPAVVPDAHKVTMQHVRHDHIAGRDGFDQAAQDALGAFLAADFVYTPGDNDPVAAFTIPAATLQQYDATSDCRTTNHQVLYDLFPDGDARGPASEKIIRSRFAKKWKAEYAGIVRAFIDAHGYDSAGWGMGDLRETLILKMDLSWDDAHNLTRCEWEFDEDLGRLVQIRARAKKVDLSAFLSAGTIADLENADLVCPIRYDKLYTATVLAEAEALP